jgi:hypothetical protein
MIGIMLAVIHARAVVVGKSILCCTSKYLAAGSVRGLRQHGKPDDRVSHDLIFVLVASRGSSQWTLLVLLECNPGFNMHWSRSAVLTVS